MIDSPPQLQTTETDDDEGLIHVYPLWGREHVLEGMSCWCHPQVDEHGVVIHNAEN